MVTSYLRTVINEKTETNINLWEKGIRESRASVVRRRELQIKYNIHGEKKKI
jgi:hypothetical protein